MRLRSKKHDAVNRERKLRELVVKGCIVEEEARHVLDYHPVLEPTAVDDFESFLERDELEFKRSVFNRARSIPTRLQAVYSYYCEGLTLDAIGDVFDVSREAIRQRILNGLKDLYGGIRCYAELERAKGRLTEDEYELLTWKVPVVHRAHY